MTYTQKYYLFFFLLLISCQQDDTTNLINATKLFTTLPAAQTGLDFINELKETPESNYYQYLYTYIGGGVAVGDLNKDGLVDLYFTSTTAKDKLYLNKGNLEFQDITQQAGILHRAGFNTGVTMADVNGDGWLDIYVSRGGWKEDNQQFNNLLYINNQDETFTERAVEQGLADGNRTIQATFFDFDKDNDLDVYVSNTPNVTGRSQITDLRALEKNPKVVELKGSDRFYENDGQGNFTDVSEQVGLVYDIGFGLNPQVADLNEDGWLDVYVCNDFSYPDLVYLNNGDKTFREAREEVFKHLSFNSMGSDLADVNNDGLVDLMTLDMSPEDYIIKVITSQIKVSVKDHIICLVLEKSIRKKLYTFKDHTIPFYRDKRYLVLPKGYINTQLIKDNWNEILRLLTSLNILLYPNMKE